MPRGNRYYRGPVSDHFDGVRFYNPGHQRTDRSLRDLLRWKLDGQVATWPKSVPVEQTTPDRTVAGLCVTVIGHATMLIQINGLNILTDPVWSERASPVRFAGPRRVTAPGVAFDALPHIDIVLLSHNHYDHLDANTLRKLKAAHDPVFVAPLGNDTIIGRLVPGARLEAGDWGDVVTVAGARVHIVPAYHWSSRGLTDRRMALWCGFLIERGDRLVYVVGDTGYGDGAPFRGVRTRFGTIDLALIPIGAYAPRWFMSAQHIDPEEAVKLMIDCGARRALGIHWGTFQLTDEARIEPVQRLREAMTRARLPEDRFVALEPGRVLRLSAGLDASVPFVRQL